MEPLKVLRWPRPLLGAGNEPLFLLGDTVWELVHRLDRAEIETYLAKRATQGFRAVWFVLLAERDGLRTPNVEGELPLHDADPRRPNERYFDMVDHAIERIAHHGMYAAILPTWGDKATPGWGDGPLVFPTDDLGAAESFGEFVGRRYGHHDHVLWVLGGDRPVVVESGDDLRPVWRAMSAGLDRGAGRHLLTTYHTMGGRRTSGELHDEPWLDVHGMQTGHGGGRDVPGWEWVADDLALAHPKPTMDSEPNYEDHPVSPWPTWDPANGHFDDYDARKAAWRTAFAGACGVTYGHHSVWQIAREREGWINHPLMDWREALDRPGATQMGILRRFLEERDFASMRPDPSLIAEPWRGPEAKGGMRGDDSAWIYTPTDTPFRANYPARSASWFDPRTGEEIAASPALEGAVYSPPGPGDWALLLSR